MGVEVFSRPGELHLFSLLKLEKSDGTTSMFESIFNEKLVISNDVVLSLFVQTAFEPYPIDSMGKKKKKKNIVKLSHEVYPQLRAMLNIRSHTNKHLPVSHGILKMWTHDPNGSGKLKQHQLLPAHRGEGPNPADLLDQYICGVVRFQVACSAHFNDLQHTMEAYNGLQVLWRHHWTSSLADENSLGLQIQEESSSSPCNVKRNRSRRTAWYLWLLSPKWTKRTRRSWRTWESIMCRISNQNCEHLSSTQHPEATFGTQWWVCKLVCPNYRSIFWFQKMDQGLRSQQQRVFFFFFFSMFPRSTSPVPGLPSEFLGFTHGASVFLVAKGWKMAATNPLKLDVW